MRQNGLKPQALLDMAARVVKLIYLDMFCRAA